MLIRFVDGDQIGEEIVFKYGFLMAVFVNGNQTERLNMFVTSFVHQIGQWFPILQIPVKVGIGRLRLVPVGIDMRRPVRPIKGLRVNNFPEINNLFSRYSSIRREIREVST